MVAYLDQRIGTMLATLDELGIAQNTIVILLADKGTDRDLTNQWRWKKHRGRQGHSYGSRHACPTHRALARSTQSGKHLR